MEDRYELLESISEASEGVRKALLDLAEQETFFLEMCLDQKAPDWLSQLVPFLRVSTDRHLVSKALGKIHRATESESQILMGEGAEDEFITGEEAVRNYLMASRKHHLRCAKLADQVLNGTFMDDSSRQGSPRRGGGGDLELSSSSSTLLLKRGGGNAAPPPPTAQAPGIPTTPPAADVASLHVSLSPPPDAAIEVVSGTPLQRERSDKFTSSAPSLPRAGKASPTPLSTTKLGGGGGSDSAPPPLIPSRVRVESLGSGPVTPVGSMSNSDATGELAKSVVAKPRPTHAVPPLPPRPPHSKVEEHAAPAIPQQAAVSPPEEEVDEPAVVPPVLVKAGTTDIAGGGGSHKSPRGTGRGLIMGRQLSPRKRGTEVVGLPSEGGSLGVQQQAAGKVTWVLVKPPKCIGKLEADEVLPGVPPNKWEVQKKTRLVLAPCVLTLDDSSLSSYDPKHQSTTLRQLNQIVKATRSNRNPRKLKVWTLDGCERFVFSSGKVREQFLECLWARRKLVPPEKLWCEPLEIFIGTWNLGEACPPADIQCWLQPGKFDVYVVSAQEAKYELEEGDKRTPEQHFFQLIESTLGSDFQRIAVMSLMYIRMGVWVRNSVTPKVSNVRRSSVATGIGNVIGNKGGTFVSMTINNTSFCFIGSHLAAREERYEQRCQNVQQILSGINAEQPIGLGPDTWFDVVFWTGDLNFRVVADRTQVCRWAKEGNVQELLAADQLSQARRENKAFYLWTEPAIKFTPSYRFDRGSMEFSDEKMRTPSYCDRVLWRAKPGIEPQCTAYDCCHELQTSDHHPVWASFLVDTRLTHAVHERRECKIIFSELRAKDLHFVWPDREPPFILFNSSFTKPGLQTSRATVRGAAPRWADSGVPRLKPFYSGIDMLRDSHLSLAIRDGKNDVAQGVVSLREACGPAPWEFTIELTLGGAPAGQLQGSVHVTWPSSRDSQSVLESVLDTTVAQTLPKKRTAQVVGGVLKQGFLLKQGSRVKSWKRRWFILSKTGELAYFADQKTPTPLDRLKVYGDRVHRYQDAKKLNCIAIDADKRRLLFCADDQTDFEAWMQVLQSLPRLNAGVPANAFAVTAAAMQDNDGDD